MASVAAIRAALDVIATRYDRPRAALQRGAAAWVRDLADVDDARLRAAVRSWADPSRPPTLAEIAAATRAPASPLSTRTLEAPVSSDLTPDLGRVRTALDTLDRTLREHPEIGERTARFLAGDLAGDPEGTMSDTDAPGDAPVKLPGELLARADALIPRLRSAPELVGWGRVTRAAVIRLAVMRGLAVLEAEREAAERKD